MKRALITGITLGAMAGITAILFHSISDFNLHIPANALLFTVLAAIVVSPIPDTVTSNEQRVTSNENLATRNSEKGGTPLPTTYPLISCLILTAIGFIILLNHELETFEKCKFLFEFKDNSAGQRNWSRRRRTRKGEGHGRPESTRKF